MSPSPWKRLPGKALASYLKGQRDTFFLSSLSLVCKDHSGFRLPVWLQPSIIGQKLPGSGSTLKDGGNCFKMWPFKESLVERQALFISPTQTLSFGERKWWFALRGKLFFFFSSPRKEMYLPFWKRLLVVVKWGGWVIILFIGFLPKVSLSSFMALHSKKHKPPSSHTTLCLSPAFSHLYRQPRNNQESRRYETVASHLQPPACSYCPTPPIIVAVWLG